MKRLLTLLILVSALQSCDNKIKETTNDTTILVVENEEQTIIQTNAEQKISNKYQLENENLIFTFQTKNKKMLTICIDKDEEYIVYRYGTSEKIEMEYPENKDKSSFDKFEYSGWIRGGGIENAGIDLNYLAFSVNQFKYVVYHTYFAVGEEFKTGIKIINTETNKTTDIKGVYETQKGTLTDFRFDDRIKKGDELYD